MRAERDDVQVKGKVDDAGGLSGAKDFFARGSGMTDDSEFLRQIAEAIGGRPVSWDDANTSMVRLPTRLARGEVFIFSLGSEKRVGVEVKMGSSLYLVVGGPGHAWSLATTALDDQTPPVYYAPGIASEESIRRWLGGGGSEAIERLTLGPDDRVRVYANGIDLDLSRTTSPTDVARRIHALVAFARTLPPAPRERSAKVPAAFADLQPFARRWAVTDDHDRAEALERANKRDLGRLVDAVVPRLADIELMLDAAGEPLSEEMIDLQALAQAAVEADIELKERKA